MEATTVNQPAGGEEKLRKTALGVSDIVFFIVAASAPLTAVAGGQAATYLVTGNAGVAVPVHPPRAIVLALFAVGYAAMSRHVANAGAFYAYVAKWTRQGPGRRRRVRRADRLQRDADRHLRPLRRRDGRRSWPTSISITLEWYVVVLDRGRRDRHRSACCRSTSTRACSPSSSSSRSSSSRSSTSRSPPIPARRASTTGRVRPERSPSAAAVGAAPDVLRRLVRRLRVGGDLQRGVPRTRSAPSPARRSSRVGLIAVFYALSSLAARRRRRAGHDRSTRTSSSPRASRPTAAPDPTTVLFITGQDRSARSGAIAGIARCSPRRCSRRCSPSTTRSRATSFALGRERRAARARSAA